MAYCFLQWLLLLVVIISALPSDRSSAGAEPISSFAAVELTEDRFKLPKQYDLPPEQRYEFEGHGYVPAGTTGVSVMQVFGAPPASGHNTTLMLHVYGGRLVYYHDETRVVDAGIYDRWFRLNVVHDVGAGLLTVFIDGEERLVVAGRGAYRHYFKFGVYTQTDPSHYIESRWRDVKVYYKILD